MHSDVHLLLHTCRAAELHRDAAGFTPVRPGLRHRMGWTMIELGLRLARSAPPPACAARAA
ncbi:hypothetical protein OG596_23245 [Streptomyces sp. NBC_01102]|uniref:hypothetical protein n=1 Tax=Streptomyces sp. NBC_01102 TaxID=2903749 RepID=UPI00386C3AC3|nr:hypothetical protein OG596_23245 [Streptomyces sp. NBC_01102]